MAATAERLQFQRSMHIMLIYVNTKTDETTATICSTCYLTSQTRVTFTLHPLILTVHVDLLSPPGVSAQKNLPTRPTPPTPPTPPLTVLIPLKPPNQPPPRLRLPRSTSQNQFTPAPPHHPHTFPPHSSPLPGNRITSRHPQAKALDPHLRRPRRRPRRL